MSALQNKPVCFDRPDKLVDRESLGAIFGSVKKLHREPLPTVGFTGARHERITLTTERGETRLVLKYRDLALDWIAKLGNERRGRECELLDEQSLEGVWRVFESPYVAYAYGENSCAVLMHDLSAHLFPDIREPIDPKHESALIGSLARMHADFWQSAALAAPWLASASDTIDVLSYSRLQEPDALATAAPAFRQAVGGGWKTAMSILPARAREVMMRNAREITAQWESLPRTLVHGDVKVANFAIVPSGRVAAFDWTGAGAQPCSIDLGWYIAVNATRLSRSKEELLNLYRNCLERELGCRLDDPLWRRLEDAAVLSGARMLLWSKANALSTGTARAKDEWDWWISRLERM